MPLNWDPSTIDRLNISRVVLVTLTFHHLGVGFMDKPPSIFNGLLRRHVKTPVRHIHHPQSIVTAAVDCFGHHHDLIEGHSNGTLVAK